jgi:multiple sugar transport system permease protein
MAKIGIDTRPSVAVPAARQAREERLLAPLFLLPAVLVVAGTYVYPAVLTLIFSLGKVDLTIFGVERFVGFGNYLSAIRDPQYQAALWRTLYMAGMVVGIGVPLGMMLALLLNQPFFGRGFLRVLVLLPWAVPPVVTGVIWGQLFHADFGLVNAILTRLGIIDRYIIWLGDPSLALKVIITALVWQGLPLTVLVLLSGLQAIPTWLYEAAAIDGASDWRQFLHITLPLMVPFIIPVAVLRLITALKAFDAIFVLTRGGPGQATTTLNYYVYLESFEFLNMGYGSATAYLLLVVTVAVIAGAAMMTRVSRRRLE